MQLAATNRIFRVQVRYAFSASSSLFVEELIKMMFSTVSVLQLPLKPN
jgi:hypothetical protein